MDVGVGGRFIVFLVPLTIAPGWALRVTPNISLSVMHVGHQLNISNIFAIII